MEKIMIRIKIMLAGVLLIVMAAGCATTNLTLPPGTLNAEQVTALFSGKTVESKLDKSGRVSFTYYNPNGGLRQLQNGQERSGIWRVTKKGRICLQFAGKKERCRAIVQEGPVYRKYIVKSDGSHIPILTYMSFRSGDLIGQ
jgi:hypothetical protein